MGLIEIKDLVKRYGAFLAVDNVNLSIEEGEIFGLLGPNGAGKSTIIKMLMGLLKPNGGEINIDGKGIREKSIEIRRILGFVPQEVAIYEDISAKENIEYFGKLYGLRGRLLKERVDEALEFVGLSEKKRDKPKKFSGGMKRRLNIACAIVHQPKIIIMDEPTVGIDPQSRNHILGSVRELNRKASTIIYTSHYMEEVESLCERVGIMDHGKLIAYGHKNDIKKQAAAEEVITIEATDIRFNPVDELKSLVGVKNVALHENIIEISTSNTQENLQDVMYILSKGEVRVKSMNLKEPTLETVFLSLTGRNLRD